MAWVSYGYIFIRFMVNKLYVKLDFFYPFPKKKRYNTVHKIEKYFLVCAKMSVIFIYHIVK